MTKRIEGKRLGNSPMLGEVVRRACMLKYGNVAQASEALGLSKPYLHQVVHGSVSEKRAAELVASMGFQIDIRLKRATKGGAQ